MGSAGSGTKDPRDGRGRALAAAAGGGPATVARSASTRVAARTARRPAQLPVAVSVLALAVVARWLGLDLSGYLPGAIR